MRWLTVLAGRFVRDDGQLNRCVVRNIITATKLGEARLRLNRCVVIF